MMDWKKVLSLLGGLVACGALMAYGVTEEVPIGSVGGTVTMKENGKALPKALVTLEPVYKGDTDSPVRIRHTETNADGAFSIKGVVAGEYLLTISGKAHEMGQHPITVAEGAVTSKVFPLPPMRPYMETYASQHVYTPGETPKFQVKGFFEKGDLVVTAFKLDMAKVLAAGSLYSALNPLARPDYKTGKYQDPATIGKAVAKWTQTPKRDVEGVFVEGIQSQALKEGLYWLQVKGSEGLMSGTWLSVTKIALVGKKQQSDSLAFVTDIKTGEPVSGAVVSTFENGTLKPAGQTSAEGTLRFQSGSRLMLATLGESAAFVDLYVGSNDRERVHFATYTDRPIYRPGDTIELKGIMRTLDGNSYVVPPAGSVELVLKDSDDNELGKQTVQSNAMGTYAGRFTVPREAGPGYYSIISTYGESTNYTGVSVAAYRKPTYSITVSPDKPYYIRGDRARMRVKAEYYFGGPVPNATVEAYIYKSEFFDPSIYGAEYAEAWGDEETGYGGSYVTELHDIKTDDNGEAWIEFDTKSAPDEVAETDYIYNASVSVVDEGGKYYDGSGSVKVMRGDFSLAADTDRYVVQPNAPFVATIRAANVDGKPVANQKVDVTYGTQLWNGKDMEFFKSKHETVTLDSNGVAQLNVTPERAGTFALKAESSDNRGNRIATTQYLWVDGILEGSEQSAFQPTNLEVTLDRRQYRPGDTALAVIKCDNPGGSALVTIEADRLYEVRSVKLDKPAVTIELPVNASHAPNAFVTISYVKDKEYHDTQANLRIDDPQKKLNVSVTADKDRYNPGDTATYTIKTTSESGQPLPAEVSLAVVDESIYALSEDRTDLLREFYPRRYNRVETQYSFPDIYLDGDKAPTSIEVRRNFKDTAFWAPQVATDASGTATVVVPLPDNLTTWRATAYGVTSRTEVGKGVSKVLANRDLMVRLETPAFLVGGDNQRVIAVVTNKSGADGKVNVEFSAPSARVEGQLRQSVDVPNGSTKSVNIMVSPDSSGQAILTAKAWIEGGANDGVESKIEVYPNGRTVKERHAGALNGSGQLKLTKRPNADTKVGRLRVTVAPTLAGSLIQSLDDLIDFPYGCVEQTMSRFMPLVTVTALMEKGGFPKPSRANEIPKLVTEGTTRLIRMQRSDGAWGWWEYGSEGDTFMTAYVLDGMLRAKQAGFPVNKTRIDNALSWAAKRIKSPLPALTPVTSKWEKEYQEQRRNREIDDRAYLAWLLAAYGNVAPAKEWFASTPASTSPLVAAYAARSAAARGSAPDGAIDALAKQAVVSGAIASWTERYWGVETTARCFEALVTVNPQHPLVDKAARWLMERKKGRMWTSTRDTSFALLGLGRYLASTKELGASGQIVIKLNNQSVGTVLVSPSTSSEAVLDIPISNVLAGENLLEFTGIGVNRIYYSAELYQVDLSKDIQPEPAEGLSVERRYYKLSTQKFEDGSVKFAPGKQPLATFDKGDLIQVQVILTTDRPREFVLVEDPLPSACRVTDREDVDSPADWGWWWDKLQIFDEKVAIFARNVPTGTSTITYTMRAENPGTCSALPTSVSNMYDPDAVASSGGSTLEVRP